MVFLLFCVLRKNNTFDDDDDDEDGDDDEMTRIVEYNVIKPHNNNATD